MFRNTTTYPQLKYKKILFDNLPFYIQNVFAIKSILSREIVTFKEDKNIYNKETGEPLRTTYNKYKNLTFIVKYNEAGIPLELVSRGSFHYLMNDGKHNANQFSFTEMHSFLLHFERVFDVDLRELQLLPPEFAINVEIPFDVEKIVQNTFCEKRKQFIVNPAGTPSKISGKPSNDYRLKVYSKFHEHPQFCKPNTLRLEYQAKKMRALHKLGIHTLYDLLEFKNWILLKEFHLSYFRHLVLYDYNIQVPKNSKYKKRISKFSNSNTWENLVKDIKKGIDYDTKYNEEVNTLNMLSKKYGVGLLSKILKLTESQWNTNLNICMEYSFFTVKKLKNAPHFKPKNAPFIACNPCQAYLIDHATNYTPIPQLRVNK